MFTGERRYHCFAYVPSDEAKSADSLWNVKHVQELDESDPINDLEDYAPEVLKKVNIASNFITFVIRNVTFLEEESIL